MAESTAIETTATADATKATDTKAADTTKGADATKTADDAKVADKGADAAKSIIDDDAGKDKSVTVQADWPSDWREKLAGDNKEYMAELTRFKSPDDMHKSYRAMRQKVSSGELKASLKANATDEEKAAWRKDNGIPEAADKYELKLSDGLVVGEDDKPLVDDFLKVAHGENLPAPVVNKMLDWYFATQDQAQLERDQADVAAKQENDDALRAEWGENYRPYVNAIGNFLAGAPEGLKANLLGARLANGNLLGNDAEALKWLASVALEINPAATVVAGTGAQAAAAAADELTKLKTLMGDQHSEYWKGPNAEKNQARYRDLLKLQEKQQRRAA